MGGCFSCRSSPKLQNIRVVHLNGYVEDFHYPVTVLQVTGGGHPPKQFLCTQHHLLSAAASKVPLKPETQLQPGRIYLLLPYTTLQSDVSPLELAAMARKLTAMAKTSECTLPKPKLEPEAAGLKSRKARSWRPDLDTIGEKSFRRSESSLQEKHLDSQNV